MTRVLILTGDPIGERMAGPAIRVWNTALTLQADGHDVRVVTTTRAEQPDAPFDLFAVAPGDDRGFRPHERWAEVVLFQGYGLSQFPSLRRSDKYLVADVYDPMHLEMLEQGRELPEATWALRVAAARDALDDQLRRADLVLCASERQRLFYLGHLAALGRINPATYRDDPDLRGLLDLMPFGLDPIPPTPGSALRDVIPGFDADSKILIWGGGVYSWFDPLSLIRAVAALSVERDDVRLFFLGTRHPGVDEMGIVREAFDLARELGVEGTTVVFNDTWVPYVDRGAYLLDADVGVSTHHIHVETTFAFRTRILDYLWASLPMVVTDGDGFADLVRDEQLGVVVPGNDVAALTAALAEVLDPERAAYYRSNVERIRDGFAWPVVLGPLRAFVADPHHAADYAGDRDAMGTGAARRGRRLSGPLHDVRMAWHHLRHSGSRDVIRRLRGRLGRRG
ncbi:MAG: glycosyltransferase family 4 protein [Pseudolysinimonas sp.]|uniref:glycosyltransferase family 4 protein n=1 Tax=Pseudolysinimonas sp. TaxID=2680009 RepID=UPI003C7877D2